MMARQRPKPPLPESAEKLVKSIGDPVSAPEVDTYGKLREIEDRSYRIRTVVLAWKKQQDKDRHMREKYALWLMAALGVQAVAVNVVYVLIGCGVLAFESWTAKTFIMAVFGEIAALVLLVVKYLYTPSSDKILDLLSDRPAKGRKNVH